MVRKREQAPALQTLRDRRLRRSAPIAWWFPGGYRAGEDSDFGIINPDGTDRPVTKVIRRYASKANAPALPVTWTPACARRK